jgi:hypothetical protein
LPPETLLRQELHGDERAGDPEPTMQPCGEPSRPRWLGLAPGTARLLESNDRQRPPCSETALTPSWRQTGPLHGARAAGFAGPARGTREFLRRRPQSPAAVGPWPGARRL